MIKDFRNILRKDSHFLKSMNLIDYSLLVVRIHWPSSSKEIEKQEKERSAGSQTMMMEM